MDALSGNDEIIQIQSIVSKEHLVIGADRGNEELLCGSLKI